MGNVLLERRQIYSPLKTSGLVYIRKQSLIITIQMKIFWRVESNSLHYIWCHHLAALTWKALLQCTCIWWAYSCFLYLVDVSSLHADVCSISVSKINSDWSLAVDTAENTWRCIKLILSVIWQRESLRIQCSLPPAPRLKYYVLEMATAQPF